MELTISIIYGSARNERQGIKAARFLERQLKRRKIKVHFVDPLELPLPFLDKMYKEYEPGTAPENMEKLADWFREADAFLVVTAEYNHSVPPALKNLLDHFQKEYFFKPSAIASYSTGHFGGVRAAVHLRAILGELGMPSISSMLPFPGVGNLFDKNLISRSEIVDKSANSFLDELLWYAEGLKEKRKTGVPF